MCIYAYTCIHVYKYTYLHTRYAYMYIYITVKAKQTLGRDFKRKQEGRSLECLEGGLEGKWKMTVFDF